MRVVKDTQWSSRKLHVAGLISAGLVACYLGYSFGKLSFMSHFTNVSASNGLSLGDFQKDMSRVPSGENQADANDARELDTSKDTASQIDQIVTGSINSSRNTPRHFVNRLRKGGTRSQGFLAHTKNSDFNPPSALFDEALSTKFINSTISKTVSRDALNSPLPTQSDGLNQGVAVVANNLAPLELRGAKVVVHESSVPHLTAYAGGTQEPPDEDPFALLLNNPNQLRGSANNPLAMLLPVPKKTALAALEERLKLQKEMTEADRASNEARKALAASESLKQEETRRLKRYAMATTAAMKAKRAANPHWWAKLPLSKQAYSKRQQQCLAEAVYFEARSEIRRGQIAVAQVVLNRVRNPSYPSTICGVVYQNQRQHNACQFSFACDGVVERISDRKAWKVAKDVARKVSNDQELISSVNEVTHYHATYVRPRWAKHMKRKRRIGRHVFYKTYGGGWS